MQEDGMGYPIIMHVKARTGNNFSGEIQWPTLNSAKTKFKGIIKGDNLEFEEYEVISGQDDVEVPMKYHAKVSGNTINGKNEHEDPACLSTFVMNKIAVKPSKGILANLFLCSFFAEKDFFFLYLYFCFFQ
jgi:hypothetical protein